MQMQMQMHTGQHLEPT